MYTPTNKRGETTMDKYILFFAICFIVVCGFVALTNHFQSKTQPIIECTPGNCLPVACTSNELLSGKLSNCYPVSGDMPTEIEKMQIFQGVK